jgi:hypothetical protein
MTLTDLIAHVIPWNVGADATSPAEVRAAVLGRRFAIRYRPILDTLGGETIGDQAPVGGCLWVCVDPDTHAAAESPIRQALLRRLPTVYWQVVGFGALFMLARFSEAFLVLRGSGHSFFNLVSELALLVASVLAGLLWDRLGAATTFLAGAGLSLLAMVAVLASPVGARRAGG